MDNKLVIDLVCSLLLVVAALMCSFLGIHLKLILTARTTLENAIYRKSQLLALQQQQYPGRVDRRIVNPFDQGKGKT